MNNAPWPPWTYIHHNDDDENVRTLWWYEHSVQFKASVLARFDCKIIFRLPCPAHSVQEKTRSEDFIIVILTYLNCSQNILTSTVPFLVYLHKYLLGLLDKHKICTKFVLVQ